MKRPDDNSLETVTVKATAFGTITGRGGRIIHVDPNGTDEAKEVKVHPEDAVKLAKAGLIGGDDDGDTDPYADGDRPFVPAGQLAGEGVSTDPRAAPDRALAFTAGGQGAEDGVEQTTGLATLNSTLHPQDLGKVATDAAAPTGKRGPGRPAKADPAATS